MQLTLSMRRTTSGSGRRLSARGVAALLAAIVAGAAAPLVVRPLLAPPSPPPHAQPVWAGAIGDGMDAPAVVPTRETSASYTSPVAIQAAKAARPPKTCDAPGCAAPQRDLRTVLPPRRPAPEPAAVASAPPQTVVAVTAPSAPTQSKSIFSPSGLIERLPTTSTLLKPFTTVGDKVSGLIKRF